MRYFYSLVVASFMVLSLATSTQAQVAKEYALPLRAEVSAAPASITLKWDAPSDVQVFTIFRRPYGETKWGPETMVDPTEPGYTDVAVEVGKIYEYRVGALRNGLTAYGFITTGISIPAKPSEGTVLLLLGTVASNAAQIELSIYTSDLIREGWNVEKLIIAESETPVEVKAKILEARNRLGAQLRSVFLFGRVPIPYSGNIVPDGHEDHKGAWPADVYYGELDGTWTDATVNQQMSERDKNRNRPNDGKFDQNVTPSAVELEVGRVDMRNMGWFYIDALTPEIREASLLTNYLVKNHAFRTGQMQVSDKAVVSDVLGKLANNDIPASSGWRAFSVLVGNNNVEATTEWMTKLGNETHRWAYGGGFGTWFAAEGIGTTEDYSKKDPKAVFTMLFGSRFGDWDSDDNLLRAPLGTSKGLASVYGGRPYWYMHPMGLGMTIGEATRQSQSASASYIPTVADATIQMALMGDPTLRNSYDNKSLSGLVMSSGTLSWEAGADGYLVSRGPSATGPFTPLTSSMITLTNYVDASPSGSEPFYLVRPVYLRTTASGTYYEGGRGSIINTTNSVAQDEHSSSVISLRNDRIVASGINGISTLTIIDILGRTVTSQSFSAGDAYDTSSLPSGAYIARLMTSNGIEVLRFNR